MLSNVEEKSPWTASMKEGTMKFKEIFEVVGLAVDVAAVFAIVVGLAIATILAIRRLLRSEPDVHSRFRRSLGRSILLGLELLVAADIVRTVAVTPTLDSVAVLAAIVLIRTFLSWSLELEVSGRWPWQKNPRGGVPVPDRAAAP